MIGAAVLFSLALSGLGLDAAASEHGGTELDAAASEHGGTEKGSEPKAPAKGLSDTQKAQAQNPLASLKALNFQNYFLPEETITNTFIRLAMPHFKGRLLWRLTVPILTMPVPGDDSKIMAGLGDVNFFASVNIIQNPTTTFGIGPFVVFPTTVGTNDLRDTVGSKWQVGGAMLIFKAISPVVSMGALITYQISVGNLDLQDQSLLVAQPFGAFQIGKGWYLRSAGIWTFDFENGYYTVPLGLGVGKVLKAGKTIINAFMEPTFTVFSNNPNAPIFQLYSGVNLQFM
jgi:hypothetical protein